MSPKRPEKIFAGKSITFRGESIISPFALKRRANPSAAFREIYASLSTAVSEDEELASALASASKNLRGVVLQSDDAVRLAAVEKRGSDKLDIKVGSFSSAIGPGLAYMYDAALETLHSSDRRIEPDIIDARMIRTMERSYDSILPFIGSMSVVALELALDDEQFGNRLRQRASEVGTAYLDNWNGPCELCELRVEDETGRIVDSYCGTEKECEDMGTIMLVLLAILLVSAVLDWIW